MAFWSSETLLDRVESESIVSPFHRENLKSSSYELRVGNEIFVTSDSDGTKKSLSDGQQFTIPPGQFALLITHEIVNIPVDAIGFISMKAGVKFSGLINVSGFHVDPGFRGKLKFAVYNAGCRNAVLSMGSNLFMLWLSSLDRPTEMAYQGEHADQNSISNEDIMKLHGEMASPAALNDRLTTLEERVDRVVDIAKNTFWTIGVAVAVAVAGSFIYDTLKGSDVGKTNGSLGTNGAAIYVLPSDAVSGVLPVGATRTKDATSHAVGSKGGSVNPVKGNEGK